MEISLFPNIRFSVDDIKDALDVPFTFCIETFIISSIRRRLKNGKLLDLIGLQYVDKEKKFETLNNGLLRIPLCLTRGHRIKKAFLDVFIKKDKLKKQYDTVYLPLIAFYNCIRIKNLQTDQYVDFNIILPPLQYKENDEIIIDLLLDDDQLEWALLFDEQTKYVAQGKFAIQKK